MLGLLQDSLVGSHSSRITHRSTESKHPTITQTHSVHFRPPFAPFGRRLAGLTKPRRILFSFRKSKTILLIPSSLNHFHPSQSEKSFLLRRKLSFSYIYPLNIHGPFESRSSLRSSPRSRGLISAPLALLPTQPPALTEFIWPTLPYPKKLLPMSLNQNPLKVAPLHINLLRS